MGKKHASQYANFGWLPLTPGAVKFPEFLIFAGVSLL